jgi:hypothetical protein
MINLSNPPQVIDLRAPRDPRLERVKIVPVAAQVLVTLLSRQGEWRYRVEGWPEGAEVVGFGANIEAGACYLILHRPDFPALLVGQAPEYLSLNITGDKVEPEPEAVEE